MEATELGITIEINMLQQSIAQEPIEVIEIRIVIDFNQCSPQIPIL